MKTIIATLAIMLVAVSAMAGPGNTDEVTVNIEVAQEVQMWANDTNVNLVLDGANRENSAAFASSLSHINNVAADITANVDGTLPAPNVSGGGIQFSIFDGGDEASALSAIADNAYTAAGAKVWDYDTLGTTQAFKSVPVSTSISAPPIVYAAAAPGELPLPNTFALTVTWTITAQ